MIIKHGLLKWAIYCLYIFMLCISIIAVPFKSVVAITHSWKTIDTSTEEDIADLSITKITTNEMVKVGQTLTYNITVTDLGPADSTNVVVSDILSDLVIFQAAYGDGWTCDYDNLSHTVICSRANLAANLTSEITLLVVPVEVGDLSNTVTVSSDNPDNNPDNNQPTEPIVLPVEPPNPEEDGIADLSITKSGYPSPVETGQTLTYTISVSNAGPITAVDVVVSDNLSDKLIFHAAYGDGWDCDYNESNHAILCTLLSLSNGTSSKITLIVVPIEVGDLSNSVTVSSAYPDDNPSDNQPLEPSVITVDPPTAENEADLMLEKSASPSPVLYGQTLAYTITVSNTGPSAATDVVVSDQLDDHVIFHAATGENWTCGYNENNHSILCRHPILANGSSTDITVLGVVNGTLNLTNTATVSSNNSDDNPGNNQPEDPILTPVSPPVEEQYVAFLSITKNGSPTPVEVAQILTYTITISNAGPANAANVIVSDNLPDTAIYNTASGDGWTCNYDELSHVVLCTLPSLASGSSAEITLLVTPTRTENLSNTATVSSDNEDDNPSNNQPSSPSIIQVVPITFDWYAVAPLNTARHAHTATLLFDNTVLVTGGEGNSGYLDSAEEYDPVTNQWVEIDTLTTARSSHTATMLPDGRVLIVGGKNEYGPLDNVEAYDPVIGAWEITDSLSTGRTGHTATLLTDGRVLVAGGFGETGQLASAEVFNPTDNTWNTIDPMPTAREDHTASINSGW